MLKLGGNLIEPFQTEEFLKLKQSLIKQKESYLDIGILRKKEYYLILIDNVGFLINRKLEIELEYPLHQFAYENVGFHSFQLKLGDDYSFRLMEQEKQLIISYMFNTERFTKLKKSLISKHKFTYLDFGLINKENGDIYYFLLVDDKGYLLDKETNVTCTSTKFVYWGGHNYLWKIQIKIRDFSHTFELNREQKEKIDNFRNSLVEYEPSFLMEMEHYKTTLLTNDKSKALLTNFLEQHLKASFKEGELFEIYEEDLLSPLFCRDKKITFSIAQDFRDNLESYYQKLLEILFNWNILDREAIGDYGFILINRSLKDISIEYYTKEFEKQFGGYFSSTELLNIEAYIDYYYTIDFLDHDEKENIGFFAYYLFSKNKDFQALSEGSLFNANQILSEKIADYEKIKELKSFEYNLMNSKKASNKNGYENISIDDVDLMSGREFEEFISYLFKKMGYTVNLTPASGDQGIDLMAVKNGLRIGIQTKCYSNSVSNKAIQEVVAGVNHYNLTKAIVITNNYFTKSAIELALSNDVVLWDRSILKEKILESTTITG